MSTFDLPLAELRDYRPPREEAADFDAFWAEKLADARATRRGVWCERIDAGLRTVDVFDVALSHPTSWAK